MTSTLYLTRDKSTAFVRDCGVPIGDGTLADLASRGDGPRYSIINGRTLYQTKDLLAWLAEQANRPPAAAAQRGRFKRTPNKTKSAAKGRQKAAAAKSKHRKVAAA